VTALWVAVGAAVGAPLRYLVDQAVRSRHDSAFPWGTLIVNVAGSLLLGFLIALPANDTLLAVLGTGFCGALTTYSTFGYETLRLVEERAHLLAFLNVAASLVLGLGAAYAGLSLAGLLS
jgi:CrcB protein